jgi:mRNA-degrading endonuclease toxin of MazEF toxin-antitoxin module
MAERGDVLLFPARIGFGTSAGAERGVVVQATDLSSTLPTLLVVPLDVVVDPYVGSSLLVPVSASEAGDRRDYVAIPTHLRFVSSDRFEPGRVGRLARTTLAELDERLRLILDL